MGDESDLETEFIVYLQEPVPEIGIFDYWKDLSHMALELYSTRVLMSEKMLRIKMTLYCKSGH